MLIDSSVRPEVTQRLLQRSPVTTDRATRDCMVVRKSSRGKRGGARGGKGERTFITGRAKAFLSRTGDGVKCARVGVAYSQES